eukprot:COSAG02_NODE_7282_length_3086_cov_1.178775_4_plen_56_part_00
MVHKTGRTKLSFVAWALGVRILTAALDDGLNETKFIVPGLGDYGDRYYGNRRALV